MPLSIIYVPGLQESSRARNVTSDAIPCPLEPR